MSYHRRVLIVLLAAIGMQEIQTSGAENALGDRRLINREFRPPNDVEVERMRGFLRSLDRYQTHHKRRAYRCEGKMSAGIVYTNSLPETFVSIRAVDTELSAVREIQERKFTKDDDPILRSVITDAQGYADSRTSNMKFFPRSNDRLTIEDRIFRSNDAARSTPREEYVRSGDDRNFEPVALAFLNLSSFFRGSIAVSRVSNMFGIEKLKPDEVSIEGDSFVMKYQLMVSTGPNEPPVSSGSVVFIEFVSGLPATTERWQMLSTGNEFKDRVVTKWKEFGEIQLPVHVEALRVERFGRATFEAEFEWKFGEDVPDRLFDISDVDSKNALRW